MRNLTTTTATITFGGHTREVKVVGIMEDGTPGTFWHTEEVFAARIGRGTKVHRTAATMIAKTTEAELKGFRYRVQADNGVWFGMQTSPVVRNRTAQIVGWAAEFENSAQATQQTYYGTI
jgi:hypothetical protein